jgi:TRAP-type C4-dicarboxylate transport system substrate-binding protein
MATTSGTTLAQEVKLTLSHNAAPGNPKDEGSKHFVACAAEKSGSRIEVQVAGSAQLGDDAASITGMRTGSIDMSAKSQGALSTVVPEFGALGMPYLFASPSTPGRCWTGRSVSSWPRSPRPRA